MKTEEQIWAEIAEAEGKWREEVDRRNKRLLRVIEKIHGKRFINKISSIFKDLYVGTYYTWGEPYSISRNVPDYYEKIPYGRSIKGFWVEQWATGTEGDSFSGYVYIELKPGRYLKAAWAQ